MPRLQVGADDPSNMGIPSVQRLVEATRVIFASSDTKSCVLSSELRFPNLIVSLAARRHSLTGERGCTSFFSHGSGSLCDFRAATVSASPARIDAWRRALV